MDEINDDQISLYFPAPVEIEEYEEPSGAEANDLQILMEQLGNSLQTQIKNEIETLQKANEFKVDELDIHSEPFFSTEEKPQPMPICYYNLISGRATRTLGTSSGSPEQGPAPAVTDDENEVPSRNFLKRQSVLIVDTKSRRKVYRPVPQRRK